MFEARKRTALDGKEWWCVYDMDKKQWSTLVVFGRYKLKRDCQFAINKFYELENYINKK